MNKFLQWSEKYLEYSKDKNLRKGQNYMNALAAIDIDLYHEYTGTAWDCFYRDEKCNLFMEHLMKDWNIGE